MSIQVASFLVPKNDNTWFIIEDIYIKGGFRCLADVAARDAINPLSLKSGMLVYTMAEDSMWKLGSDLATWTATNLGGGATGPQGPQGIPGLKGEQGIQGVAGPKGDTGEKGDKGDQGDAGPQGIKGSQGLPGTVIRQSTGVPGAGMGLDGDYYINTLTQDLYYRSGNSYSVIMNLRGATGASGAVGPAGANGVTIRVGVGAPDNALGITGDMYIDSSTDNGYMKNAVGVYALQFNLRGQKGDQGDAGPQGIQGIKGDQGDVGPQGPKGEQGIQGIKGDKGDTGATGPAGATAAHAATHAKGGADEITPAAIGALALAGGALTGDVTSSKSILAKNAFATVGDLPAAGTCTGSTAYVAFTDAEYYSNGTTWVKIATGVTPVLPYDLAFFIAGTMTTGSELVGCFLATRKIFLPVGVAGSLARAKVAPSAAVVYDIKINGVSAGTVTFAAGSSAGTISWTVAKNLLQGDTLEIYTPAVTDSAISNVIITLVGSAEAPQGVMQ